MTRKRKQNVTYENIDDSSVTKFITTVLVKIIFTIKNGNFYITVKGGKSKSKIVVQDFLLGYRDIKKDRVTEMLLGCNIRNFRLNLDSWISLIKHYFNELLTSYDRMYE